MPRKSVTVGNFEIDPNNEGNDSLANDPMTYLQRLFVYFLQNLFRDVPEGSGMRWRPDLTTTELLITGEKPKLEEIEKRPHITCVLGGGRWTGMGLDQLQKLQVSTGERQHTDLMPMTMSYHCQAKEGVVARRIAFFASISTNQLRRILMRIGGLHHVGVQHNISPEGPVTQFAASRDGALSENELVEVVVNIPFYWQPQWRIKKPSEVWRRMQLSLRVDSASPLYSAGRQNKLRPPAVKGVPVNTVPLDPPETAFVQTVVETEPVDEE